MKKSSLDLVWQKLSEGKKQPDLYHPIEHSMFSCCSVAQPCEKRYKMIKQALGETEGSVLDLGCHTGWNCRAFAKDGWITTGIEKSLPWFSSAVILNELVQNAVKPEYENKNLFDIDIPTVDVVLLLSVLMYLFEDEKRGWDLLNSVSQKARTCFIDFGGKYSSRLPFNELTFPSKIMSKTKWRSCTKLGNTDCENRPLFMLERKTMYWVFGGTAIGKKQFITVETKKNPRKKPAWMADGKTEPSLLIKQCANEDLLVRWQ